MMKNIASLLGVLFCASVFGSMKASAYATVSCAGGNVENGVFVNEDRFRNAQIKLLNGVRSGRLFMVCDGHGHKIAFDHTDHTAAITCDNLLGGFVVAVGDPCQRFIQGVAAVEKTVLEQDRLKKIGGSMLAAAFLKEKDLYLAHVGDCRAIVFGKNLLHETKDHRFADLPGEMDRLKQKYVTEEQKKRIQFKNQAVSRVNGAPTSRLLGNASAKRVFKKSDLPDGVIVATPDVQKITLNNAAQFLLLASDGVWDVMTSEEVVSFVNQKMRLTLEQLESDVKKPLVINLVAIDHMLNVIRAIKEKEISGRNELMKKAWDVVARENQIDLTSIKNKFAELYPRDNFAEMYKENNVPTWVDDCHVEYDQQDDAAKKLYIVNSLLLEEVKRRGASMEGLVPDNMTVTLVGLTNLETFSKYEKLCNWWLFMTQKQKLGYLGGFSLFTVLAGLSLYCHIFGFNL